MRILFLMAVAALLAGCTFTIIGNAPKTEAAIAQNKTINATFAKSEQFINACADTDQDLAEIRFHTNPAYLIVSLLSFGLYVPQNVTWWCGAEEAECEEGDTSEECEIYVREDD